MFIEDKFQHRLRRGSTACWRCCCERINWKI